MKLNLKSLSELEKFAQKFAHTLKKGSCVTLQGELGTGKTTFIALVGKYLNVTEYITSPTFTLVNKYQGKMEIYHLDLYRINSETDLYNMDIEYYFRKKNALVFVEWAEKLESFYPQEYLKIEIEFGPDDSRVFQITAQGSKYEDFIQRLNTVNN